MSKVALITVMLTLPPSFASAGFLTPVNLGSAINTQYNEGSMSLTADGLTIFFQSTRPGGLGPRSIWEATRSSTSDTFGTPTVVTALLSEFSDFSPDVSANGLEMFFISTRDSPAGQGNIWRTSRTSLGEAFSAPTIVANINSEIDDGGPSLSQDGLTLYFSSLRSGGSGQYDLWAASRSSLTSEFGSPVNLGAQVNSEYIDGSPSISADELTIYFASTRPGGSGERSIWKSTRDSTADAFGTPEFVSEVSSSDADGAPYITPDGTLYLGSNRSGGFGGLDIWVTPEVNPIPEPSSAVLLAIGVMSIVCRTQVRRRNRTA